MKPKLKILAVCASPRRGTTYKHIEYIKKYLTESCEDIEFETVMLKDEHILPCLGCTLCYDKGESFCPHKDSAGKIVNKMDMADAVIFASPTYVMNMSHLMKNFIDRLSYICHRPRYTKKETMLLATCAGSIGASQTIKSMGYAANAWGFHIADKCKIVTGQYTPQEPDANAKAKLRKSADRLVSAIRKEKHNKPGFIALTGFMYRKICYRRAIDKGYSSYDLTHWQNNGYLNKGLIYFHPVKTSKIKALLAMTTAHIMTASLK